MAALVFLALTLALRVQSFFPTVIDHDESTYMVIADALLRGATYQVEIIDTKPVGIFLIFAGLQSLFGSSIAMLRMATALVVAATASVLYAATLRAGESRAAGLAAGIIYVVLTSSYAYWGLAPNTEIYFNLCTVAAVWICLGPGGPRQIALAGLCLGLGFLVKQVVVFDAAALGLFLWWRGRDAGEGRWRRLGQPALLGAGMVVPFLGALAFYQSAGHLAEYWFHSYTVPSRYPAVHDVTHYLNYAGDFFARYLPITVLYVVGMLIASRVVRRLCIMWSLMTFAAVMIPGRYFEHYFVHFMLPFSFAAGLAFSGSARRLPRWLRWIREPRLALAALSVLVVVITALQARDFAKHVDSPAILADAMAPRLLPGDGLYAQRHQILYHLLDRSPPNRYVHPTLLMQSAHVEAMEIDVAAEVGRIRAARPRFIVLDPESTLPELHDLTRRCYRAVATAPDGVVVFERVPVPPGCEVVGPAAAPQLPLHD